MLTSIPGKKLNQYTPGYVIFDLETTGTSCIIDAVVEISAVKVKDGKVVDEFPTLVNPERPIPSQASDVNGICDDMVADSPGVSGCFEGFFGFCRGCGSSGPQYSSL